MRSEDPCALCGLPVGRHAFIGRSGGEERAFCCAGCARVYDIAHDAGMLDAMLPKTSPEEERPEGALFITGQTVHLSIQGMWCASCSVVVERLLRGEEGVLDAEVSFACESARVRIDATRADPCRLAELLTRFGFHAQVSSGVHPPEADRTGERLVLQFIAAMAFGMHLMTLYVEVLYPAYATGGGDPLLVRRVQHLTWLLATPLLLYGGRSILQGALRSLRARTASMDTLVGTGLIAAYAYSATATFTGQGHVYFDTVAMVTMMVVLGRVLEHYGGLQARKEVRHLLAIRPERASRREGDAWEEVPAVGLMPGDVIRVRAGERVPADALVEDGRGEVTESVLTGEFLPVPKGPGERVYAGSVLAEGVVTARVVCPPGETRLAQITVLVERTLAAKPQVQRLADRACGTLACSVLGLSLATLIVRLALGSPFAEALRVGVTILVVACPCSLGLATPLALAVALGRMAGRGILIRNPEVLETASAIRRAAFDKTGTLTQGRMAVTTAHPIPGGSWSRDGILRLAAAVEQHSEHPIARAIMAACREPLPPAADFRGTAGQGVVARVGGPDGTLVRVGSAAFVGMQGVAPLATESAAPGETVVWVEVDGAAAGCLALRDALNPTAAEALWHLSSLGVHPVVLSGDGEATVRAIAGDLGVDAFESGCSPEGKAAYIRAWQEGGERVAMVGDGVNDAPALAQADLSITVAGGTAIAGETSDVLLARADLELIPWLLGYSARVRRTIRANLAWALAYNLVALPLAVAGRISPILAAATMAASSILVVANSLQLRWREPRPFAASAKGPRGKLSRSVD